MNTKSHIAALLALGVILCASAAWAGEEDETRLTWHTRSGDAMALDADRGMMFLAEDGETFDLADLQDGETRTFGEGDKRITVTRNGEIVTIDREAEGEERRLEIVCDVDRDTCQVMTLEGDPERVMLVVKKTRTCEEGEGDCEAMVDVHLDQLDLGEGPHKILRKMIHCNDEGECEEIDDLAGHGAVKVYADLDGSAHGDVMIMRAGEAAGDKVVLRCPEGDSTITVDKEEADDVFLCPKHSVPMEKSPHNVVIKTIEVVDEDD